MKIYREVLVKLHAFLTSAPDTASLSGRFIPKLRAPVAQSGPQRRSAYGGGEGG
jgi:hypothetical protein